MKIYVGSDHAGFDLKEDIVEYLRKEGYEVIDKGAYQNVRGDDYPEYIAPVAEAVSAQPDKTRGLIFGGSGQGEAMVANRFSNVRATVYYGAPRRSDVDDIITLSREHNNANVLSIGARFVDLKEAKDVVKKWIDMKFSGEVRHKRRIGKIEDITQKKICTTVQIRTNLLGSGKRTTKPRSVKKRS
jgi:ribose 5-phosphate isomerase B